MSIGNFNITAGSGVTGAVGANVHSGRGKQQHQQRLNLSAVLVPTAATLDALEKIGTGHGGSHGEFSAAFEYHCGAEHGKRWWF